jgi:hypothetical protein
MAAGPDKRIPYISGQSTKNSDKPPFFASGGFVYMPLSKLTGWAYTMRISRFMAQL